MGLRCECGSSARAGKYARPVHPGAASDKCVDFASNMRRKGSNDSLRGLIPPATVKRWEATAPDHLSSTALAAWRWPHLPVATSWLGCPLRVLLRVLVNDLAQRINSNTPSAGLPPDTPYL